MSDRSADEPIVSGSDMSRRSVRQQQGIKVKIRAAGNELPQQIVQAMKQRPGRCRLLCSRMPPPCAGSNAQISCHRYFVLARQETTKLRLNRHLGRRYIAGSEVGTRWPTHAVEESLRSPLYAMRCDAHVMHDISTTADARQYIRASL
ncbi:hypothetical protein RRF57_004539 [Xylaria bambusicola]|uniref:Uncharacterized protein n=1 Tax=Xylaria bambusicola TaxID=326684 RepID=A0AAN7UI93_9PEZI